MVNGLHESWMRVSSIMDSGAAESVARTTTCPTFHWLNPLAHKRTRNTEQRTRERLENKGQRDVQAWKR